MSISSIQSLGIQGLASAAQSDMKIAQLLQTAASQMQAQADKVTISPEAMKLLGSVKS
jgi:hypothetical protein